MAAFIRRHPFWAYYGFAISLPILLFTYLILLEIFVHDPAWPHGSAGAHFYASQARVMAAHPILTFHKDGAITSILSYVAVPLAAPFLFFPFAPTVSAAVMTWVARGGGALKALLGCYRPVRGDIGWREGVRLYAVLIAFIGLAWGVSLALTAMFGAPSQVEQFVHVTGVFDWRYFLAGWIGALFTNQGGLLEELGWRGYALPVLIRRLGSPLVAASVLGVAWAAWHFPREAPSLLTGAETLSDLVVGQAIFVVSCIASTIVFTGFVNLSGGSVVPSIMLHGLLNHLYGALSQKMVGTRGDFLNPSIFVWIIGAALMVICLGADLGYARRRAAHGGDGSTDPANAWSGAAP